jgi:NAD(P)H dehydrogenase (quinone)
MQLLPAMTTYAVTGVDRLLFVSGSEAGRREAQHRGVVEAAQGTGATCRRPISARG